MEKESFENEEVASLLNERFISIKVDREERPDIDSIYMLVCQMMTGHGGWPLSVFLTPNQVPFYAGTYFPRESRYGMPGFKEIITYLSDQFRNNPKQISRVSDQIQEALQSTKDKNTKATLSKDTLHRAFQYYNNTFDKNYGGFGDAPKFPMPHTLTFLLRYYKLTKNENALRMVTKTLDGLANGGIYDQIGYGFSRYSVDEKYLVPHFEKMLYDNALLVIAYTEAYQITKEKRYKKIVEEIATYLLRDMQHKDGGFYSAEDADSEGEEGKFYIWTPNEIKKVLGDELGAMYCQLYDITETGNFEGKNIPNLITKDITSYAAEKKMTVTELHDQIELCRKQLFDFRETRVRPFRDDKILTAWNGLAIAALAKAARVFAQDELLIAAEKAITFIEKNLIKDHRLMVRYRDGEVKHKGYIDDYAFMLWGYLELYDTTLSLTYIEKAKQLSSRMIQLFWDEKEGGFFFTGQDQETLLIRQKESYDGALPSGNSVAAIQLLRLAKLTGNFSLEEKVQQIFTQFSQEINNYPNGHTMMLQAYLLTQMPMKEIVILQDEMTEDVQDLINQLQRNYYPEMTLLLGERNNQLEKVAPFTKDYSIKEVKPTIYICENFQCNQPTNDVQEALDMINSDIL